MRWLFTFALLLVSLTPVLADDHLAARPIEVPLAAIPDHGPWDFDLIDPDVPNYELHTLYAWMTQLLGALLGAAG